jgi:hypothetical protein
LTLPLPLVAVTLVMVIQLTLLCAAQGQLVDDADTLTDPGPPLAPKVNNAPDSAYRQDVPPCVIVIDLPAIVSTPDRDVDMVFAAAL